MKALLRRERFIVVSLAICAAFLVFGDALWARMSSWTFLVLPFAWVFVVVLGSALAVVRHAEALAALLGDPCGTLILTLAVTVIEVTAISAVMLHGEANPTLARDTLFAVVMIVLDGMVGLSLLVGGWRHREQYHNLQGADVYLGAAIPLIVLSLVLPDFTVTTARGTLSFAQQLFLIVVSVGLYGTFLVVQTGRHSDYFALIDGANAPSDVAPQRTGSVVGSSLLLVAHLVPALFLAEQRVAADRLPGRDAARARADRRRRHRDPRRDARGHRRRPRRVGQPAATLGQHLPGLGAVDDRHHGAGDGRHQRAAHESLVLGVQHTDRVLLLTLTVTIVAFSRGRTNTSRAWCTSSCSRPICC